MAIDFKETQLRSYKQIRADIAALEREAAAVRKSESAAIVAKIRKLAEQYDLTAADIGLDASPQAQGAGRPVDQCEVLEEFRQVSVVSLVDTGPLVALCNQRDAHHEWTVAPPASVTGALTTCEPVQKIAHEAGRER